MQFRIDDGLYADFRGEFPNLDVARITAENINATASIKEKWRNLIMRYEKRIAHYNFGTLLRLDASGGYTEENSHFGNVISFLHTSFSPCLVTRTQFYAIEIARNKEGINDTVFQCNRQKQT